MTTKKYQWSIVSATAMGTVLSIALTVVLSMLTAIFISNEYFDINIKSTAAIIIQGIAALAGSYLAYRLSSEGKGIASVCCAAVYYVMLLSTSIMLYDGVSTCFWVGMISCAVGSLLAILLINTAKKTHKQRRRVKRYR